MLAHWYTLLLLGPTGPIDESGLREVVRLASPITTAVALASAITMAVGAVSAVDLEDDAA